MVRYVDIYLDVFPEIVYLGQNLLWVTECSQGQDNGSKAVNGDSLFGRLWVVIHISPVRRSWRVVCEFRGELYSLEHALSAAIAQPNTFKTVYKT